MDKILKRRNQYDIRLYKSAQLIVRDRMKILNAELAQRFQSSKRLEILIPLYKYDSYVDKLIYTA